MNNEIIDSKEKFLQLWQNSILNDESFKNVPGFTEKKLKKNINTLNQESKMSKSMSLLEEIIPNDYASDLLQLTITENSNKDESIIIMLNQIELKIKAYSNLAKLYKQIYFKINESTKDEIFFFIETPYAICYAELSFLGGVLIDLIESNNNELKERVHDIYLQSLSFTTGDARNIIQISDVKNNTSLFYRGTKFILNKIEYSLTRCQNKELIDRVNSVLNNTLINHTDFILRELDRTTLLKETKDDELLKYYNHVKKMGKERDLELFNISKAEDYIFKKLPEEMQFYFNENEPKYIINDTKEKVENDFVLQTIKFPHILFDKNLSILEQIENNKNFEKENLKNVLFTSNSEYDYIKDINIDINFKNELNFNTLGCEILYTYKVKEEFSEVSKNKFIENFLENINVSKFELKIIKNNENKDLVLRDIYLSNNLSKVEKNNQSRVKKKV